MISSKQDRHQFFAALDRCPELKAAYHQMSPQDKKKVIEAGCFLPGCFFHAARRSGRNDLDMTFPGGSCAVDC